jgi:hypothetical protein
MEWLWWALLLLLVIGWPLLFALYGVVRRKAFGAPTEEYALKEHGQVMLMKDIQDVRDRWH